MRQLHAWHRALLFDEAKDAREHGNVIVLPYAQILRADASFGKHGARFGHHHCRSSHRAAAQVNEVPVVREAVDARILTHRRHANAIPEMHLANFERCEKMRVLRNRRAGLRHDLL